jgi:hypothetical protein
MFSRVDSLHHHSLCTLRPFKFALISLHIVLPFLTYEIPTENTPPQVWDNEVGPNGEEPTFALLFSLRGHSRSITALQIGDFTFASGDASGQVRVWELIQPASAGGPSEASASAAGGFAGQATVWIGPDGQDPKWARCRCVLRVKHQRSEDAPDYAKVIGRIVCTRRQFQGLQLYS